MKMRQKEGEYDTLAEFRESWEDINGEGAWDPDLVVDVVEFEYVGEQHPQRTLI